MGHQGQGANPVVGDDHLLAEDEAVKVSESSVRRYFVFDTKTLDKNGAGRVKDKLPQALRKTVMWS